MEDTSLATTRPMPVKKPYKPVAPHGTRYVVRPLGPVFEVRRVYFERGKIIQDQLVTALPTEQDADDAARYLSGVGS